jgi:hypothetical protein
VGEREEGWVQCERPACRKWRRIPATHMAMLEDGAAWYCENNPDDEYARCEQAQELSDDEIDRRMEEAAPLHHSESDSAVAAAASASASASAAQCVFARLPCVRDDSRRAAGDAV